MKFFTNTITLWGLSNYMNVIEELINDLNLQEFSFDIKLILTEALTNAFKHGNKCNECKPIYLKYCYDGNIIEFEIKDCGTGTEFFIAPDETSDENILDASGRGLFLIKSFSDKVEFKNNILNIQKFIIGI